MKLGHLLLVVLCGLLLAEDTVAQQAGYGQLQDSLNTIRDVPLLYRMERAEARPADAGTLEPVVRRGLIALRLWELTNDRADAKRALETFEAGAERFPAEAWGHYGVALALAQGPEVRLPIPGGVTDGVTVAQSFAEIIGQDPRSRARRAALRALERDAGFAPAAVLLGDLALADGGRSRDRVMEARNALAAVRAAGRNTPQSDRALADVEIALGNYAAAEDATGAAEDAGALRARAVALLLQEGRADRGAGLYWRGAEQLDASAAAQYYADLELLATPAEAAEWRIAGIDAQRVWLARFWERRAAESGVTVAERLAEHYRRLTQARGRYLRNSSRGSDGVGVLMSDDQNRSPFDDRGVVLVRHGEPLEVVRTSSRGLLPNETWVYNIPGHGRQLFHFAALRGSQSFLLISDLMQALDRNASLYVEERDRAVLALVADRARFEPRYQAMLPRLERALLLSVNLRETEVRSVVESVDADYRRGARIALRNDSHARRFNGDLDFFHDVFGFRTPHDRTDVTAAFAVPAAQLRPVPGVPSTYDLRLSVILHDTLLDVVTRRDTVQRIRRTGDDHYVRAHVTLPVVPSEHTVYRLVAEDASAGRGALVSGGSVIRDYAGTSLLVSDVVLALPDSAGDWARGDLRLALALPRSFAEERPFTVFYEIYNMPADAEYSTRIVVEGNEKGGVFQRMFGGRGQRIDLRFDDVARPGPDGVLQESRRVASDLPAGDYRMIVTITSRGRTARTETRFSVDR